MSVNSDSISDSNSNSNSINIENEKVKNWNIIRSNSSKNTHNPIRAIVDRIQVPKANQDKPLLPLNIGDPTIFGNFKTHEIITESVVENVRSLRFNGYTASFGLKDSQKALAEFYSTKEVNLTEKDVFICSGCSGAIQIAIEALSNPGDNILVPKPGFPIYITICGNRSIECRFYNLLPEKDWDGDIQHAESLINEKTKAIVINNPSNPCGSVFSKEHLQEWIALAERHCLPIIADEIYADMTFKSYKFHSLASLSSNVPIITVGGLAKRWLVPGWRIGWIIIHDPQNYLLEVRQGILDLTTILLGANTIAQSVIPNALKLIPQQFYDETIEQLERNANFLYDQLSQIICLEPVRPKGAMYLMVRIKIEYLRDINDDFEFTMKLLNEEFVYVLPGKAFNSINFIRLVVSLPIDKLIIACQRIHSFCLNHLKKENH
eukprot:TRINITY_DN2009_c0_g1_i1.p1 TRINITY_DN2009_c0_g1~~TRINITY_DN2009_c0_g1_i1.p1  ORF type:complete len:435 (+),score=177.63 TRINITY_DN2009_c0_g1_i1:237-1541(+)